MSNHDALKLVDFIEALIDAKISEHRAASDESGQFYTSTQVIKQEMVEILTKEVGHS